MRLVARASRPRGFDTVSSVMGMENVLEASRAAAGTGASNAVGTRATTG